jgi:hypothetical protein
MKTLPFNSFCEVPVAFAKTGIAYTPPLVLKVGEERDGKVWSGKEWIEKEQWEKQQSTKQPVNRL